MNVMTGSPKTKSRSIPDVGVTPLPNLVYNQAGSLISSTPNVAYTESTFSESIAYTTKRRNQRAKSNQCRHVKETFHYSGGRSPVVLNYVSPAGQTNHYFSQHGNACNAKASVLAAVNTAIGLSGSGVLGANAQTYINDAWDRLRPDLTSVSIPNFLADIEDIKKLYQVWKKSLSIAKNLAGLHLNYQYGWKPTIGDLSNLIEGVTHLRSKLAAFEAQLGRTFQGKTQPSHSLATSASGSLTLSNHTVAYSASCTRNVECFVAWQPQPLAVMGPMDKVLRGLLDSLGFELNPNIIWDAVPFTFVIDWFFDVGSWLSRYKVDALELPILMCDSFCQYTETLHIEWTWLRVNDGTFTSRPKSGGCTYERTFFHRVPIYPDYSKMTSLGWKLPNFNQAALGVSLATLLRKK